MAALAGYCLESHRANSYLSFYSVTQRLKQVFIGRMERQFMAMDASEAPYGKYDDDDLGR